MGIDYGAKRVGVAVSDASGSVAFPKTVLPNDSTLVREVCALIASESVSIVILGESVNKDGGDNAIMEHARAFKAHLEKSCGVEVALEPEYYSTREARVHTGEYSVDAEAAAILLNSYITKRKGTPQHPHDD